MKTAAYMHDHAGAEPVIEQPAPNRWRVVLASDRVEITVSFRGKAGRRDGSTLTVDGTSWPLPEHADDSMRIFRDPDLLTGDGTVPPIPASDIADAPPAVRQLHGVLARRIPGDLVRAGYDPDQHRWIIGLSVPNVELRLFLTRAGRLWGMDPIRPFQVIVNGEDLTARANGDLAEAIALTAEGLPSAGGQGTSPVRQAAAKRSNAVETRRQVVIRRLEGQSSTGAGDERPSQSGLLLRRARSGR